MCVCEGTVGFISCEALDEVHGSELFVFFRGTREVRHRALRYHSYVISLATTLRSVPSGFPKMFQAVCL